MLLDEFLIFNNVLDDDKEVFVEDKLIGDDEVAVGLLLDIKVNRR